jgi:hypothetical protein
MDEDEMKETVASALESSLEDCEVCVKPAGLLLLFMNGDRWLLRPLDVSEREEEDDEEDEEGIDEDEEA